MGAPAAASPECSMSQMEIAAESVIEPCGIALQNPKLTPQQRAEALFVRGRGYHRTGRLDQAAYDYDAALRLTPTNEEILLSRSNIDARRGEHRLWAQKVEEAAKINPDNPRVVRSLARVFWWFGYRDQAMELYGEALRIDPTEAFALLYRSREYQARRKFSEAINDAHALVEATRDPIKRTGYLDEDGKVRNFHVIALINRAEIFEAAGQLDSAAKDYDAAVAEGRTADALVARSDFFLGRRVDEQEAKGIADLKEAVQVEPTHPRALFKLGMLFTSQRRYDLAFEAFNKAIVARPSYSYALQMRARMHREFGRSEEAFRDFMTAVQINPYILQKSLHALRHAGYWTARKLPAELTPDLLDAIRACMMDTRCN
jgi:tetratricopeptide (TPR) repeat protein